MWAAWLDRPLSEVCDESEWFSSPQVSYAWGYIGGKIRFANAIPLGTEVKFYYITNKSFKGSGGGPKERATIDSDIPRIPERVVALGLIWRWRQMKRLEYAEDMATATIALEQAVAHDKPRRALVAPRKYRSDIPIALDGIIIP
jgi:hypothetical protein